MLKKIIWFFVTLSLYLLSTAAGAASAEDYFANAEKFYAKGESKAAVIELKNALRADPAMVEARLLLGKIYVKSGDGIGAEKELKRAAKLDAPRQRWIVDLGDAYLLQGKFQDIITEIDPSSWIELPDKERVALFVQRGNAYLGLRQLDDAESTFDQALEVQPQSEAALVGKIRLAIARNEMQTASQLADELLRVSPDNVSALLIRGEIDRQAGRQEEAVKQFSRVVELNPDNLRARLGRAAALIALGQPDKGLIDLDFIEQQGKVAMVQYLRAVIKFQKRDIKGAAQNLEIVLGAKPDHAQSMFLYGTANYILGQIETADQYLTRAHESMPNNVQVAKLYAAVKMKLKEPKEAIAVLEPIIAKVDDAQVLALLGSAYLMDGNHSKGSELLQKAVEKTPNLAALRAQLAIGLLAEGDTNKAISQLQSAVDLGQDLIQADIMLVLTHLREKNYEAALQASAALEKRMPESAVPYNLTGMARFAKKDFDLAAEKFAQAIQIDPSFEAAKMNMARLNLAQGKKAEAQANYEDLLKSNPKHLGALIGMASLAREKGDYTGAQQWLETAQQSNPNAIQPGLMLAELFRQNGENLKALSVASELSRRYPDNSRILLVLGTTQMGAGEINSAIRSFEKVLDKAGESQQVLTLLATAQTAATDYKKARDSYKKAIAIAAPADKVRLQLALASMEIKAKRYDRAMAIATELRERDPKLAATYDVEGAVKLAKGQKAQALAAYQKSFGLEPTSRRVLIVSRMRADTGDLAGATTELQKWLDQHPKEGVIAVALAIGYQKRGMLDQAISAYEHAYALNKQNFVVLNNLAWLYFKNGDPRALEFSAKAYELMPERPEVVDTYGWILLKQGKSNRALNILQQAFMSAPDNSEIGYHVAVAMDKVGRKREARDLLRRILEDDPNFDSAGEARGMLERLGG